MAKYLGKAIVAYYYWKSCFENQNRKKISNLHYAWIKASGKKEEKEIMRMKEIETINLLEIL